MNNGFDIAVIGGGSAGLTVAAAATQFGERVVLFEKSEMGGDCLNTGCVPSKALLAAAKSAEAHRSGERFGIAADEPKIDFAKVMTHVESVIAGIAPHDSQERFESLGVTVVRAPAQFVGKNQVEAAGQTYAARRIVVATGSRAGIPPIPGLADINFFTNETIFKNREKPSHLLVIGGGPIGLEMAQAHRRLGSQVTVLEAFSPLAKEDPELAAVVINALKAEGIVMQSGVQIAGVSQAGKAISVNLADGSTITGSHLLVAAGRLPNIEGLQLEKAGIDFTKRGITVGKDLRSVSNRAVYAAGDVAGGLQFTHVAGHQAGLIVRNALFRLPVTFDPNLMPRVTYTDPELAHVGLTEAEAKAIHGDATRVLRSHFADNDRARAEADVEGLVKVIAHRNGKILGASIVGHNAGDQIAMWSLAVNRGLKLSQIAGLVLPYPTRGEAGRRAATQFYGGLATNPWVRRLIGILKYFG